MLMIADTRLALQAYEKILDLIMSGALKLGALIRERKLTVPLSMSRTPLRDALLMLEGEGLLVRQPGRGLQVKQLALEDFMENLHIRRLLEPEAARAAAGRIPDAVLADLAGRLDALIGEAGGGTAPDRALAREVDNDLHDLIADAAGNRQMAGIVRNLRRQTVMFDLRSVPERLEATCAEHLALVAALRRGEGEAAADAMRRHLDGVRQSIVRRLAGS
jgi:DNA-binding GntR family transcriptional regulator